MAVIHSKVDIVEPIKIDRKSKHKELCEIGVKILRKGKLIIEYPQYDGQFIDKWHWMRSSKCNNILVEPQNITGIIPDVIGWNWIDSYVIEAKTSKQDFKNDKKKNGFVGKYFFYLSYPNIINIDDLDIQGLIEYNPETKSIEQKKNAIYDVENYSRDTEIAILLSILRGRNINSRR
jgi:hypothetical protein